MSLLNARTFLVEQRTSVRLSVILRLITMALNSILSLLWTRLIIGAMGVSLYGVFVSFQGVTRLSGLGDLGISGAVAVRAGQMMGRDQFAELRPFLAGARTLFLLLATLLGLLFLILSPFLPHWLGFDEESGAGSMQLLFATGAISLWLMVLGGYLNSLNSAYGTVTWPIIPGFLLVQLSMLCHWWLAVQLAPLWIQNCAYLITAAIGTWLSWIYLCKAHHWLGELLPLRIDHAQWKVLAATCLWVYLYKIGGTIYTTTDRLVINAFFGPDNVPAYVLNSRLCELALQIIMSGIAAGIPKITQWLGSGAPELEDRAIREINRLNLFEILLGTGFAMGYLAINDLFMRWWLGAAFIVSPWWQLAFALNLAVTMGANAGIQVAGLCGKNGLRNAGIVFTLTALLNLGFTMISAARGSIGGIAYATVFAQTVLGLSLAWWTCKHLPMKLLPMVSRSIIAPIAAVSVAFVLRHVVPPTTLVHVFGLLSLYALLLGILARLVGFNTDLIRHELHIIGNFFRR